MDGNLIYIDFFFYFIMHLENLLKSSSDSHKNLYIAALFFITEKKLETTKMSVSRSVDKQTDASIL